MSLKKEDDKKKKPNQSSKKVSSTQKKSADTLLPATVKTQSKNKKKSPFDGLSVKEEKRLTRRLIGILVTLTIGVLLTLYIISPLSKLQGITIDGVDKANVDSIVKSSELSIGKNIWPQYLNKSKEMKNVIKENPRVEKAKLSLHQFNHFSIKITEYEPVAVLSKGKKTYPVLANGKILKEEAKGDEKELPVLKDFKEGESLNTFLKSYHKISPSIQKEILSIESQATKTNPYRIKLMMKDGNEVIGLSTTIADKLAFYDKIVAELKIKSVIDLEAGKTGAYSYPIETEESSSDDGLSDETMSESINNGF